MAPLASAMFSTTAHLTAHHVLISVFWFSTTLILYTYCGYPLWLYVRRLGTRLPIHAVPSMPYVSVVMAVHNEARVLLKKLANLAALDYPADRHEIIVASDGSTDSTNEILATHASDRLRIIALPLHEGKGAALNRAVAHARGEIIVFTDARQMIDPSTIRHLVADFGDPSVGCVTGELMLGRANVTAISNGVGLYWKLEKKIRQWESDTGSVVGASGALYAVRRDVLVPLPRGVLLDDVYIPLMVIRQGKRVVFEPKARAWETTCFDPRQEFRRKIRTLTGNYQLLRLLPSLLTRANPVRFQFVSHKLLRLFVPFALVAILASSLCLSGQPYTFCLILQCIFYGAGAITMARPKLARAFPLGDVALTFLTLNAAAGLALIYVVSGKKALWMR